ncbi:ATP-dependent DNA helicase PIF1-like [Calliopsis andreniformis]|uniref:ATP-dependent DNA helicase PIF1-like n=1 Tax=Calliopsis andreniformis TaxID=337506 RepID=UPI003FCE59A7
MVIRRNIDVTKGLINGTIGVVSSVCRSIGDTNKVGSIKIVPPSGSKCTIERITVKFEAMDTAFIFRKQFPVSLSYEITIHKSQGYSLDNAIVDVGNSVFSCGQVYVALSRVTSLDGLHLINFDLHAVKASQSAILEYNRMRRNCKPNLLVLKVTKKRKSKVADLIWG